jgi:hypothetical protein
VKDVHKIAFLGIGYGVILSLVIFIFYKDYVIWSILGTLTALFNHSQMIQISKSVDVVKLSMHLVTRFVMYVIMMAIVYFQLRDNQNEMITGLIILLLGFSSIKIGTWLYALPFIKKEDSNKEIKHD